MLHTLKDINICFSVVRISSSQCESHPQVNLTSEHGFLSSTAMTESESCDGSSHPWVIIAQPGQTINLTLYDFSLRVAYQAGIEPDQETSNQVDICLDYGLVEDEIEGFTQNICGGQRRVSHIYRSHGHVLKVWITNPKGADGTRHFLVEYNGILYMFILEMSQLK